MDLVLSLVTNAISYLELTNNPKFLPSSPFTMERHYTTASRINYKFIGYREEKKEMRWRLKTSEDFSKKEKNKQ